MATLQSCRLISPTPLAFGAASAKVKPHVPHMAAFVPAGGRDRCFSGVSLRQGQTAALRPCVVVRAQKRGGVKPGGKPANRGYFVEEMKHVMDRYDDIIYIDNGCLYMEATAMSGQVCLSANQALKMPSYIMDSASLNNLGVPNEISTDTIHRTLRSYVKIFVDSADASYNRTVSKKTVLSFLGALRGLASITHILLDTALEALSDTHPTTGISEYAFNYDIKAMHLDFNQQMSDLEDGIGKASNVEICKLAMPGILEGTKITGSFVGLMVARRKRALEKGHSGEAVLMSTAAGKTLA